MKQKTIFIIFVVLCLFLSGCSFAGMEGTNLLKPPKTVGEEAQIQNLIENTVGTNYKFIYPQNGDYRSAIIIDDFSGDRKKEALAFYKINDSTNGIFIMLMNKLDDKWRVVGTYENGCTEIDRVCVMDLNNDGVKEIIVGWTVAGLANNKLTAYMFTKNSANEILIEETYNNILNADLNSDSINDLILISIGMNDFPSSVKILKISDACDMIYAASSVNLSPDIVRIANMNYSTMNISNGEKTPAVFLDGVNIDGYVSTQVIYCDKKGVLKNPLNAPNDSDTFIKNGLGSFRTEKTLCSDINKDGITEIPIENRLNDYNSENTDKRVCSSFDWCIFNQNTEVLNVVMTTITDYENGYYLKIPASWQDSYTAYYYPEAKTTTLFYVNDDNPKNIITIPIASVKVFDSDEYKKIDSKDYFVIAETDDKVFCGIIYKNDTVIKVTEKQIIENFIIF